jgi:hypothetical protein
MLAKRYGKLPTEILPTGTVSKHHELSFNINVALIGAISEYEKINESKRDGPIRSRDSAKAAILEAKADFYQMEEEKRGKRLH